MDERTTIYLADDHEIIIDGLKLLIGNEASYRIISTATNGQTAQEDILKLNPDIALIDLRMPKLSGIQIIINLKKKVKTRFIILSMHNDVQYINDAKKMGAHGYLLKNTGKNQLLDCLDSVKRNQLFFPAEINSRESIEVRPLTPREIEILKLILKECTSQDIAHQLNLSVLTVDTHRKNIIRKTNCKSLVGLVRYAIDHAIEY